MSNKIKLCSKSLFLIFIPIIALVLSLSYIFINSYNSQQSIGDDFVFNYANSGVEAQNAPQAITSNFNLVEYVPGETTEMYVLVNFVSYGTNTFSSSQINRIKNNFNDNTPNNNVFSMHEYFYEQSRGKLNVWALFMEHTTLQPESYFKFACNTQSDLTNAYNHEEQIFKDALLENTAPFQFNGVTVSNFVCRINFFAGDALSSSSSFWPKNWISYDSNDKITSQGLILYTQRIKSNGGDIIEWYFYVGVICHELTHMMGVSDYYSTSDQNFKPVGNWDLMASTDYDNPQTLSPYFRQKIGWFTESEYYDGVQTEIETITSSGTYTLSDSTSQTGTLAYKFGYKNTSGTIEYFMVEFKYKVSNNLHNTRNGYYAYPTRLLVYRINEKINRGNLVSTAPSNCSMYIFRNNNVSNDATFAGVVDSTNASSGLVQSFGSTNDSDTNLIVYSDGTNSKVVISNLSLNTISKTMTFDVNFVESVYSINGTITKDGVIYPDVNVYVNGVYKTKTNAQGFYYVTGLSANDEVSFSASDVDISKTYVISGDMPNSSFNVISKKDLEFTIKKGLLPIDNVDVFVNGVKKGTTNSLGKSIISDVYLGSTITFFHELYDFNPATITFDDLDETSFNVSAALAKRDISIQINMNDLPLSNVGIYDSDDFCVATTNSSGIAVLSNVEIYKIFHFQKTDFEFTPTQIQFTTVNTTTFLVNAVYTKELNDYNLRLILKDYDDNNITLNNENISFKLNGSTITYKAQDDDGDADALYVVGDWYFNVAGGDTLLIEKEGYKLYSFVITNGDISTDLSTAKTIKLYKYHNPIITLKNAHDSVISGVKVYKNGTLLGETNDEGKIAIANIITSDIIRFEIEKYETQTIIFDANDPVDCVTLITEQVSIKIFIKSYGGENLIFNDVVLRVDDHSVAYNLIDNYLALTIRYLDVISITRSGYVFSDVSVTFDEIEYNSVARKYINVSGTVKYKNGEKLALVFDVMIDGEKVGETNRDGSFDIINVLEGSSMILQTFGFTSQEILISEDLVLESAGDLGVEVERTGNSLLPAYIIFGVLILFVLFNIFERFFMGSKKRRRRR